MRQGCCQVEFILPLDGGSVRYEGRVIDTTLDDGTIPSFQFISQSGIQVMLTPQMFPKSSIEKVADIHNGVYVEGKTKGSLATQPDTVSQRFVDISSTVH
jgi:hypothetical protein